MSKRMRDRDDIDSDTRGHSRVPEHAGMTMPKPDMLLVPDRAVGADQSGRYLLVVNKDDVVEQRSIEIGQMVGELRVVTKGVTAEDRIVVSGLLTAVPGDKVEPQLKTLTAQADQPQ